MRFIIFCHSREQVQVGIYAFFFVTLCVLELLFFSLTMCRLINIVA